MVLQKLKMAESILKRQLLQAGQDSTPNKIEVLCEINSWAETLAKNVTKPALRFRKHRKIVSNHQSLAVGLNFPDMNSTPTIMNLKKQRDQLMKTTVRKQINLQKQDQEATKPGSGHLTLEESKEKLTGAIKRSFVRINQFKVEGQQKRPTTLQTHQRAQSLHCPRPYRKMSIQHRRKSRDQKNRTESVDSCVWFTALKKIVEKNTKHSKMVEEMNKRVKQFNIGSKKMK